MMLASASILAQASSLHTVPTKMITSSTQSSSQAPVTENTALRELIKSQITGVDPEIFERGARVKVFIDLNCPFLWYIFCFCQSQVNLN